MAAMPLWLRIDWGILHWVNLRVAGPYADPVMIGISNRALWWIVAGGFLAVALLLRNGRWLRVALVLALTVGVTDLLAFRALKPFFHRPRPCHQQGDLRLPTGCGSPYGFPSNHSANGMAVTAVLAWAGAGVWTAAAFCLALLVGLSRVYLGVHFPTDVLCGFFVGAMIGLTMAAIGLPRGWLRR
jgi:undecaprenyl-diphosphatase